MGRCGPSNLYMLCATAAGPTVGSFIAAVDVRGGSVTRVQDSGREARHFFAFNLSRPLLDAADAKSDGAAYAAAAINILDGPTVNHHRLPEHAGVITDYVTLII